MALAHPSSNGDLPLNLPPFPAVARKLMQVVANPNFTIPEVSYVIRADAVFSTEVLRLANSAMMALRYEVVSIMHGISVLGIDRLTNLVMTVAMRDFVRGARGRKLLRLAWRHNLACALLAETLAEPCFIEKGEAYTAGLLHDLGRLVLIASWPNEYAAVIASMDSSEGETLLACEARIVGMDHCAAGDRVAREWGLPDALQSLLCLPSTLAVEPFTVTRLAMICCSLADRLGFSIGEARDGWDLGWIEQQLPEESWSRLAPKAGALRESVLLKVNAFESEFLPG